MPGLVGGKLCSRSLAAGLSTTNPGGHPAGLRLPCLPSPIAAFPTMFGPSRPLPPIILPSSLPASQPGPTPRLAPLSSGRNMRGKGRHWHWAFIPIPSHPSRLTTVEEKRGKANGQPFKGKQKWREWQKTGPSTTTAESRKIMPSSCLFGCHFSIASVFLLFCLPFTRS